VSDKPDSWPESHATTSLEATAADHQLAIEAVEIVSEREGLPRNYRMRADRHYVDQLAAPSAGQPVRMVAVGQVDCEALDPDLDLRPLIESIRSHGILHPLLVRRENARYAVIAGRKRFVAAQLLRLASVPCLVHELTDNEASALEAADNLTVRPAIDRDAVAPNVAAVQRLLAAHLSAIGRSADSPPDDAGALGHAAFDLLKAHAWRAARLLGALDLVANAPFAPRRERALATIVDEVIEGFLPESRLSGITIRAEMREDLSSSGLNDGQLVAGVAGALLATLPLVEDAVRPTVTIRTSSPAAGAIAIEVTQTNARVAQRLVDRFFDDDPSAGRPGGYGSAIGALAAKALAERHGGQATFEGIEEGSRLTIQLLRHS